VASPRFDKLTKERQEEILTTAGKEFAANGFDGASLNKIIAALGISKGSFYYYFTDKMDLFRRTLEWMSEVFMDHLSAPAVLERLTADTFWSELERMTQSKLDYVKEHSWMIGLGKALYQLPKDQFEGSVHEAFTDATRFFGAMLERGQELGVVRDDLPVEVLASMAFAVDEAWDRYMMTQTSDQSELIADLDFLTGVAFDLTRRVVGAPNYIPPTRGRGSEESSS